jgi:hypothetical protein
MLNTVVFNSLQKVTQDNFNNLNAFARKSFDVYTRDLFGDGRFFTGFNIVSNGSGRITVAPGRLYLDGLAYEFADEGGAQKDLIGLAPTTLSRWVAVFAYGDTTLTDTRPTEFLTDTTSRATVSRPESQESRRVAIVDTVAGQPAPNPARPPNPENALVLGWVLLTPAGVTDVVRNSDAVVPNTVGLALRLAENDLWRRSTGLQLDALGSNIAAIQQRLVDVPDGFLVRTMAQDLARVRERLALPQAYSAYHSDYYLNTDLSQTTHVDYACTIEEGVRFPDAAVQDMQIGLLNPFDDQVVTMSGNIIPQFGRELGVSNVIGANDQSNFAMAQGSYQSIAYTQNSASRQRLRVGPYYQACSNWLAYYSTGATYDALNRILKLTTGEVLQVADDVTEYQMGQILSGADTHTLIRMRNVWADTGSDQPYPGIVGADGTVTGAMCGQTFLNNKDGYLSHFSVRIAQLGSAGDITCLLCEVASNGQPDLTKVLGKSTVPFAQLGVGPDYGHFLFSPMVSVQKGKWYAAVFVTVGNHYIQRSAQSNIMQGTFFSSSDGRWLVPDQNYDLTLAVAYAAFTRPRVVVDLNPLTLNGGMTAIDILAQMIVPNGTTLTFEAMFNGVWTDISKLRDPVSHPLNGKPPLLQFRAVFSGTRDIMPMLGVGSNSRVRTRRPQPDLRHLSIPFTPPAPVKTITVVDRLEAWDANTHTFARKVRTGTGFATITAPTAVQDRQAPEDARAILRTSVFVLPATVPSYFLDGAGHTSNVVNTFHVANTTDVATNP